MNEKLQHIRKMPERIGQRVGGLVTTVRELPERRVNRALNKINKETERTTKRAQESAVNIVTDAIGVIPRVGIVEREARGSGSVIRQDGKEALVVTNAHVVKLALQGGAMYIETSGMVNGRYNEKAKVKIPVDEDRIYMSEDHDLAFVPLDLSKSPYPNLKLPAINVGDGRQLPAGHRVFVIGQPHGDEDTVSAYNYITKSRTDRLPVEGKTDNYIRIGGSINPGNSGGMVVDSTYRIPRLIGMVTLGTDGDPTNGGAIPGEVIKQELEKYDAKMQQTATRRDLGRAA